MKLARISLVVLLPTILLAVSDSMAGMSMQGTTPQGMSMQGMSMQGMSMQGMSMQGMSMQGMSMQGMSMQGMSMQGMSMQGMSMQGMSMQGMSMQGMSMQGMSMQGMQLRGIDRLRSLSGSMTFNGLSYAPAQVTGRTLQGLQPASPPIAYSSVAQSTIAGVQLQASPTNSAPGSYLYVPGLAGTSADVAGTFWNLVFQDSAGDTGDVIAYVAGVEKDTRFNSSTSPSNDDIYLYTVYFRQPATGQWMSLCPADIYGKAEAMATPINTSDWTSAASRSQIAFACTASGVAAKCARNWGYKPWVSSPVDLGPYYRSCIIAARADYCQDDQSFTRNGTTVDLFDVRPGLPSINPTVGFPYAPGVSGPMLHEEYQISLANLVGPGSMFFQSGLESSRYPDLDPGRSCAAAPYIDRCDPTEPFTCYRESNLSAQPYGPMLAVNSPRHCDHSEDVVGEPLDPMCDACTTRVCDVDPTCCGDPGDTFYPRALVWDQACITLRDQVCKSTPAATAPWKAADVAPAAGTSPVVVWHGAIGAFDGFFTSGGVTYAEGWACDPDFPTGSSAVQVSVGGDLGTSGITLVTSTADQSLPDHGWREIVATECGGAGRHGFRVALPAGSAGKDVYVYGLDSSVPAAPFTLLRGGKKTVPVTGVPAANPAAAIWTGWLEPAVSGNLKLCKRQQGTSGTTAVCDAMNTVNPTGADLYRIWLNGAYVAGNWIDAAGTPGGFTANPPAAPQLTTTPGLYLQAGVRYPVRIEYQRTAPLATSSEMVLLWSLDNGTTWAPVPTSALYAAGTPNGNGLLGSYFLGATSIDGLPATTTLAQTWGVLDNIWTDGGPADPTLPRTQLPTGLSVTQDFGARFQGQVVPPISGDYVFSADTDGVVRITVNGVVVGGAGSGPPGLEPDTCDHDICVTGGAVSRTCKQGSFCSGVICLSDPTCCSITWDARCVEEVSSVCGLSCSATPAAVVTLNAGWRYDIKVEYLHTGQHDSQEVVRAARLKLYWALAGGGPRDVVPIERLFSTTGTAAGIGQGLNAAYFSDATFQTQALDHVEPAVAFLGTTPPVPTRSAELACGATGLPGCATANVLGAPGLVAATSTGVTGDGAARGATVTVNEVSANNVTTLIGTAAIASDGSAAGLFTIAATLARGTHTFTITQTLAGVTSQPATFALEVRDPNAPSPPVVAQSGTPVLSGNGSVTLGGTASAGATVTVTAQSRGGGAATVATFVADASGNWTGTLTLSPGSYDVTSTQTAGGATSAAGPSVNVQVALPSLTVTSPADGQTFTGSAGATTVSVPIQGQGAAANQGAVIVADGDGSFFVDLNQPLTPTSGNFAGSVALDYGRHVLKLFQRGGGLDGAGVTRTVIVQPPLGSLAITSLQSGMTQTPIPAPPAIATTDATVIVNGSGGLVSAGLPGTVIVYEGTTRVGQGPLDEKTGTFAIPVTLTGAGLQTLAVSQTAQSLSGGGSAESAFAAISVHVRPPAPVITSPLTGLQQDALSLTVTGTATPRATVTLLWDGAALSPTVTALADGTFTAQLASGLTKGTHALTAMAMLDTASGLASVPPVLVSLGDITPPTIAVSSSRTFTGDDSGASVNLAAMVSATDSGTALPASAITCSPPAAASVHFPLGATSVTCLAVDAAGNTGSTTFTVTVKASSVPTITGSGLTTEAQGPAGAVVNYKVSASGYTADCAAPGSGKTQACTQWQPAYNGLDFGWDALVQNVSPGADHGTLYLAPLGSDPTDPTASPRFLKLAGNKSAWQELPTATGPKRNTTIDQTLVVGAGSPGVLYAALDNRVDGPGIAVSSDGGKSWLPALPGIGIAGIAVDPKDPTRLHQFAYRGEMYTNPRLQKPEVYETHDGWATWSDATPGIGNPVVAMAVDPTADREYASLLPRATDTVLANLYVRENGGTWQPLAIPPLASAMHGYISHLAIAPATDGCGHPQTAPTVIANQLIYRKGSEAEWTDGPTPLTMSYTPAVTFDRTSACVVYAADGNVFAKSLDGGRTFTTVGPTVFTPDLLLQDVDTPTTFYLTDYFLGPVMSTDGGSTWAPMPPAPRASDLGFRGIGDSAVDPVDPKIVLASITDGMFKSTDGGGHWIPANTGIPAETAYFSARRITIDPFQRNVVYAGYEGPAGDAFKSSWITSPNSGATWTNLVSAAGPAAGALGLDPLSAGHWFSVGPRPDGLGGTQLVLNDNAGMTGAVVTATLAPGAATLPSPSGTLGVRPYGLQMIPDAARTVMLSWNRDPSRGAPDVSFFPYQTARAATTSLPLAGGGMGSPDSVPQDYDGLNRSNVFYDAGDGVPRVYVDGAAIGKTPNVLYRTTVDSLRRGAATTAAWEQLGGDDGHGSFVQLVIDSTSGGQGMYSAGFSNALWNRLWESHDGGHTWQQDSSAPLWITRVWLSPADGALYASASQTAMPPANVAGNTLFPGSAFGLLWKRTPISGVPVGARVAQGDLRVTCHGPTAPPAQLDPNGLPIRPASPGSTFPLGQTTITCSATDVFGNTGTATFTVNVVDSTPPVLSLDTPPAPATAAAGGTAAVTFAVSANDAIDGARPVTCSPASGSAFPIGVTIVTCSASDARSPANTASLSFPVLVSQQGGPTLAIPTLVVPAGPVEATGSSGAALVVTAATATGGALTPTCTPAVGSMIKVGSTTISCSATDPANGLRAQATFTLTVRDTTPPAVTVPGDQSVAAQGAYGAHVTYTAQAADVVDGSLTPTCAPSSGAVFALGVTQVVCRATDKAGNQGFGRFKVTVTDQSQAVLHLSDMTANASDWTGAAVTYNPAPYATDISNNPLAIECVPPSGSRLPLGDTVVTCTAAPGTTHAAEGTFVVHVVDQSPPAVNVPGPIAVEATGSNGAPVTFAATASDLVDRSLTPVCRMTTGLGVATPVVSGAVFPLGDSLVTCSATDAAGNVGSAAFSVTVHDTTPPALTLPAPMSATGDISDSTPVTFTASAVDVVSGAVSVPCTPPSGSRFVVGTTTVSCSARDAAGNESDGTFTVTVSKGNPRINLINAKYNANTALLGSPISGSLQQFTDGAKEDFTGASNNSSIYVGDAVNAAYMVMGFIRADYLSQGAQSSGTLGYPISDESNTAFGTGRYNFFQHGRSLWKNGATAAYSTHGSIDTYYTKVGLEWGNLGYPQSDEAAFGTGRKNDFEYGKIYFKNSVARGVVTALNAANKLTAQSWPRLTSASITPYTPSAGGCIKVTGAGFPAGAQVTFHTNDPGATGTHAARATATAASDGTFTFDESKVNVTQQCTPGVLRVNGLATIEASAGGTTTAIIGVSTTAGSAYTGSL